MQSMGQEWHVCECGLFSWFFFLWRCGYYQIYSGGDVCWWWRITVAGLVWIGGADICPSLCVSRPYGAVGIYQNNCCCAKNKNTAPDCADSMDKSYRSHKIMRENISYHFLILFHAPLSLCDHIQRREVLSNCLFWWRDGNGLRLSTVYADGWPVPPCCQF